MHLLHVDSSILGEGSVSRQLTAAIVAEQCRAHPALTIDHLDLASDPIPHFIAADLAAAAAGQSETHAREAVDPLERFLKADVVVIGAPMYNFTVPSQLKAWVDRILVAGRTFEYTESGPRGLAGDKEVIVAVSCGGYYGPESPFAAAEHVRSFLATAFGFIGVTKLRFVVAEGLKAGLKDRSAIIDEALDEVRRLAA